MMTDFGILYRTDMVKAIKAGTKTQTRRLAWRWRNYRPYKRMPNYDVVGEEVPTIWQKVHPGDRLWVRETWGAWPSLMGGIVRNSLLYKADDPRITSEHWRWRPNLHMFRCDSRFTQIVTDVRIERVQEITAEDALAEGMDPSSIPGVGSDAALINAYREIWESIHGASSWEANPEVVVITYHTLHINIDKAPEGMVCQCGAFYKFDAYVMAHWYLSLSFECPACGSSYEVQEGVATLLSPKKIDITELGISP